MSDWPGAHGILKDDIAKEIAANLFKVLDKGNDNYVTLDEWVAFDFAQMLPSVENNMRQEKEAREAAIRASETPKIQITPSIVRKVDFSRAKVGRLNGAELKKRLDLVGEKHFIEEIDISGHSFGKELTWEHFAQFKNLLNLQIYDSELTYIPDLPPKLEVLNVGKNRLRHVNRSVCRLKNLKELNLEKNILRSLAVDMGGLRRLERLNVKYNDEIPESLALLFDSLEKTQAALELIKNGAAKNDDDELSGSEEEIRELRASNIQVGRTEDEIEDMQTMNVLGLMLGNDAIKEISPKLARK
jgi:Leucine-rich repeat (LRR) protein